MFRGTCRSGRFRLFAEPGLWRNRAGRNRVIPIMIHYTDIAFTAYAVTKMARARRFYEKTMGLKPTRVLSKNFVEYDIGSGTLVVACSPKMWPPSRKGTAAALEVKDFPEAVEHLRKKKVKFAIGPLEFPLCWMAGIRDPDGNIICIHHRKRGRRK